jgi:hypothetical protein
MDALKLGEKAREHLEATAPRSLAHGYEKYILTDGESCLIVRSDYRPAPGQMVFFCSIKNGLAVSELHRKGKELERLEPSPQTN